jgi:ribonuclease-3
MLADAFEALIGALYLDGGSDAVAMLIDRHYSLIFTESGNVLSGRDCKTEFQESAQSIVGMTPTYQTVGASGPDHSRIFTVAAFLGNELVGEGSGRSKKEAEQEAARRGLERLTSRDVSSRL